MLESPSHSDDDLLRLIRAGDEAAFLQFYNRHQGAVYRFAVHMSGQPEIAEEVTQDVFVAVMGAAQYDSERGCSALAFLYGVARNLVLRCLRREKPYLTLLDDPLREFEGRIADPHDLAEAVAQSERIAILRKAVLSLPPAYREVVVLCDLEEMDYAEAAASLSCAIGTVRSRLHRARALLMEKMRASERCAVWTKTNESF